MAKYYIWRYDNNGEPDYIATATPTITENTNYEHVYEDEYSPSGWGGSFYNIDEYSPQLISVSNISNEETLEVNYNKPFGSPDLVINLGAVDNNSVCPVISAKSEICLGSPNEHYDYALGANSILIGNSAPESLTLKILDGDGHVHYRTTQFSNEYGLAWFTDDTSDLINGEYAILISVNEDNGTYYLTAYGQIPG